MSTKILRPLGLYNSNGGQIEMKRGVTCDLGS